MLYLTRIRVGAAVRHGDDAALVVLQAVHYLVCELAALRGIDGRAALARAWYKLPV